jgi:mutual gliding-motility protein MglA
MPTVNHDERSVSFKIVYCGTPLCGKTTNIAQLHAKLDPACRSDLVSLSTASDRTLFFDFLSVEAPAIPGYRTTFHLYTVPGQITYNATLQLVLREADGVIFVADSQMDRQRANLQALQNLEANLRLNGSSLDHLPVVMQYNKRDVPNAAPVEYLEFLLNNRERRFISFEAEAKKGRNVVATLNAVSHAVLTNFRNQMMARQPAPPAMAAA